VRRHGVGTPARDRPLPRPPRGRPAPARRLSVFLLLALSCRCHDDAVPDQVEAASGAPPRRIVSLAPSCTETLIALGAAGWLVGISAFCPELAGEAGAVRLGGLENLNVEALVALAPDLILTVQPADDRALAALRRQGFRIRGSNPQTLAALLDEVAALGVLIGAEQRGRDLAESLRARLARLAEANASRTARPTVYVEVDEPGCWTIGRGSFVHEAVLAAGGSNVFGDAPQGYFQANRESLLARAPDWVVILHPPGRPLAERPEIAALPAFAAGRVIAEIDRDQLLRSSPRLVDGIEALAARLHSP
jgi:iron complex transport system substrate-binding protein